MLGKLKQIIGSVHAMRPGLRRAYGVTWPIALARCALRAGSLIRRTRWAGRKDAEARYVRTLALLPAICLDVRGRLGERGVEIMRELTTAVVEAENERIAREAGLFEITDPRERWHAYFDRAILQGAGAFNENECLSIDPDHFHYRVYRCVFAELTLATGVPELGRIVCDLDFSLQRRLFPAYEFHRGGLAQNTISYGHACCEYVWDRRDGEGMTGHEEPAVLHADRQIAAAAHGQRISRTALASPLRYERRHA